MSVWQCVAYYHLLLFSLIALTFSHISRFSREVLYAVFHILHKLYPKGLFFSWNTVVTLNAFSIQQASPCNHESGLTLAENGQLTARVFGHGTIIVMKTQQWQRSKTFKHWKCVAPTKLTTAWLGCTLGRTRAGTLENPATKTKINTETENQQI